MVRNRMVLMTYHTRQHVETVLLLGAGASRFAGIPTTKDLIDDVKQRVIHQERWDSPMAASLARNIVRDHGDKDVEVLYQTIRDMKAAEELHGKVMKYKVAGDNHPAWKREILTTARSHPDNETKKDETKDIDETMKTFESLEGAIRNTLLDRLMVKPDRIKDVKERYDHSAPSAGDGFSPPRRGYQLAKTVPSAGVGPQTVPSAGDIRARLFHLRVMDRSGFRLRDRACGVEKRRRRPIWTIAV